MNTATNQEKKESLMSMEQQLRSSGQKLDSLWMDARDAKGQARTDIHNEMGPLREKLRMDREKQDALKKAPSY